MKRMETYKEKERNPKKEEGGRRRNKCTMQIEKARGKLLTLAQTNS